MWTQAANDLTPKELKALETLVVAECDCLYQKGDRRTVDTQRYRRTRPSVACPRHWASVRIRETPGRYRSLEVKETGNSYQYDAAQASQSTYGFICGG